MCPTEYKIYQVRNIVKDTTHYWKAPSRDDLRSWIADQYLLTVIETIYLEITEVSKAEAGGIIIKHDECDRYEKTLLIQLFHEADNGCVRLAILED